MSIYVFGTITIVLQNVEAFTLDLPAGTVAARQLRHIVSADLDLGDEVVAADTGVVPFVKFSLMIGKRR